MIATCRTLGLTDAATRRKLGKLVVDWQVLYANAFRTTANLADGKKPGAESSVEKLFWSEFNQRVRIAALEILGPGGQLSRYDSHSRREADWPREFLWSRAQTIFSGSSEVQRNIIAKRVLGLPA